MGKYGMKKGVGIGGVVKNRGERIKDRERGRRGRKEKK
jgi:hypothetical protein